MDSSIKFFTRVHISFSVAHHDVTHHPAQQSEFLSSRTVSKLADGCPEHGSDVLSWLTNQLPFLQQTNSKAFSVIFFGKI
jgi:hypothetical protein